MFVRNVAVALCGWAVLVPAAVALGSRDSSAGVRQTEDLKVPGSIPGLGILSLSCLGMHLVSGAGLLPFGYKGLSGTMRFSCFENLDCQAGFYFATGLAQHASFCRVASIRVCSGSVGSLRAFVLVGCFARWR